MTIDIEQVRAATPGCANVTHFNNAGASLPSAQVLGAVVDFLQREAAIGGYEAHAEAIDQIEGVYQSIARLVGAESSEVALLESATRAWDSAFYAVPWAQGDNVLTCVADYGSNAIAMLHVAEQHGVEVRIVPDDDTGQVDLEALRRSIDGRTRLVTLTHVPSQNGLVNPAAEVGRIAREHGVLYLLDACQSVGQLPVDVGTLGCDMLSATGRKFLRGPRGTGFLYVRSDALERLSPPMLDMKAAEWTGPSSFVMRDDARRFETWEASFACRLGLGTAAEEAMALGLEAIEARNQQLARRLRAGIEALPGYALCDRGPVQSAIVTFVGPRPAEAIKAHLQTQHINVSNTWRTTGLWDAEAYGNTRRVRASVHYFNTTDEVDQLLGALGTAF